MIDQPVVSGRLGQSFDENLYQRLFTDVVPEVTQGSTGYFSLPQPTLDPFLIQGGRINPEVRSKVLETLQNFWRRRYHHPEAWSTVWIAGSALAWQWDREGADLDVLIGVNHPEFYRYNPSFMAISPDQLDERFNSEFKHELMPYTKNSWGRYEMTFFVNPQATDIREIHPYAAYDLTHNEWTVPPVQVPRDWNPESYFNQEQLRSIRAFIDEATSLINNFRALAGYAKTLQVGSPPYVNTMTQLKSLMSRGASMFSEVHSNRQIAFRTGQGYFDYYNALWQYAKKFGVTPGLHALAELKARTTVETQTARYGKPLLDANDSLILAALQKTPYADDAVYDPTAQDIIPAPGQVEDDKRIPREF